MVGIKASGVTNLFSKEGLQMAGKIIGVDLLSNAAASAVGTMANELGLPLPITLMLSVAAGVSVSTIAGKYVFKNAAGEVILEFEIRPICADTHYKATDTAAHLLLF